MGAEIFTPLFLHFGRMPYGPVWLWWCRSRMSDRSDMSKSVSALVTASDAVSAAPVTSKVALRWLLTTTDLIQKGVQPSHRWCRARKALWLIICQRAGCQLYMKNSQKCVETVFFSQHCPRKYFLVNTRVFTCAVLQHQHSGEDPRANGQVVLEIWPTNDSEKKSWSGMIRTLVEVYFRLFSWSRGAIQISDTSEDAQFCFTSNKLVPVRIWKVEVA